MRRQSPPAAQLPDRANPSQHTVLLPSLLLILFSEAAQTSLCHTLLFLSPLFALCSCAGWDCCSHHWQVLPLFGLGGCPVGPSIQENEYVKKEWIKIALRSVSPAGP